MANSPQLENGYLMLANEIFDALARTRIPGEQRQCLDFIIRKTYGFKKKEDAISNSQFCEATGLKKGNVSRAIKVLVEKKIVIKNDNRKIPTYQFNKTYSQWKELSKKKPVIKKETVVIKKDNELLSKVMDTKEKKETITKEIKNNKKVKFDPIGFKPSFFTEELWKAALEVRKDKKLKNSELALKPFVRELEVAIKKGHTPEECIEEFATSNWTRFKAEWMKSGKTKQSEIPHLSKIGQKNIEHGKRWMEMRKNAKK
jgi:phage replication O-like protein O